MYPVFPVWLLFLGGLHFSEKETKGEWNSERERGNKCGELGGIEGGEAVVQVYNMKKE